MEELVQLVVIVPPLKVSLHYLHQLGVFENDAQIKEVIKELEHSLSIHLLKSTLEVYSSLHIEVLVLLQQPLGVQSLEQSYVVLVIDCLYFHHSFDDCILHFFFVKVLVHRFKANEYFVQVIDSKYIEITVVINKDVLQNVNELGVKLMQLVLMSHSNLLYQRGKLTACDILLRASQELMQIGLTGLVDGGHF